MGRLTVVQPEKSSTSSTAPPMDLMSEMAAKFAQTP